MIDISVSKYCRFFVQQEEFISLRHVKLRINSQFDTKQQNCRIIIKIGVYGTYTLDVLTRPNNKVWNSVEHSFPQNENFMQSVP